MKERSPEFDAFKTNYKFFHPNASNKEIFFAFQKEQAGPRVKRQKYPKES